MTPPSATALLLPWFIYPACYLIGSINFSLLASSIVLHRDIRQTGSGNAGFTNVLRTGNKKIAFSVLLADLLRAYLVIWVAGRIPINIHWPLVAIPLLLGNLWPVFHRFRGGKGIAMSIGVAFAVNPIVATASTIAMLLMIALWKKVSVGSLVFLAGTACGLLVFDTGAAGIVGIVMCLLGGWSHRENIRRLANGTEPSIFSKTNKSV